MHVLYGPLVQGVHVGNFASDGKTLQGSVDGREIVPFAVGADPKSLAFADGGAVPETTIAQDVQDALTELMQVVSKGDATQQSGTPASGPRPRNPSGPGGGGGVPPNFGPSYTGTPGQYDSPIGSESCVLCDIGCISAAAACDIAVDTGCVAALAGIPFVGGALVVICIIGGAIGCTAAEEACRRSACQPVCCPHSCGNRCCDTADTCLNDDSGTCCAAGTNPCSNGNVCCKVGDQCMETNNCCPAGDALCYGNSECCDTPGGQQCLFQTPAASHESCGICLEAICGSYCCDSGQGCYDAGAAPGCCDNDAICFNSTQCCGDDTPVCTTNSKGGQECCGATEACNGNTVCCSDDGTSVCVRPNADMPNLDSCCPENQACNTICCTPGEQCGRDGESNAPSCCGTPCGNDHECCNSTTGQTCRRLTPAGEETCCSDAEQCGTECCKADLGTTCEQFPTPHCVTALPTGFATHTGIEHEIDAPRR